MLPAGTFVFVVSDFLTPPPIGLWAKLRSLQLDVTPVVVEDPVWEQSFPRVGGVVLRVADAAGRGREDVLIRRADAERLARTNEQRLRTTLAELRRLGFDPVLVGTSDEAAIEQRFHAWSDRRRAIRRRRP